MTWVAGLTGPDQTREAASRGELHRKLDLRGASGNTEAVWEDPILDVAAPIDATVYFQRVRLQVLKASAHVRESARKAAEARSSALREGDRKSPNPRRIARDANRARLRPDDASQRHPGANTSLRIKDPQGQLRAAPSPRRPN